MKLSDRLKAATEEQQERAGELLPARRRRRPGRRRLRRVQDAGCGRRCSPSWAPRVFDASLTEAQLHRLIVEELERLIAEEGTPLSEPERERIAAEIGKDILGYGPIEPFLHDPTVTEIMVNATEPIYVEREGRLHRTRARFPTEERLRRVIDRIAAKVGRRIDEASPMVDARLPDGSRVNAIIPPLAVDGPALTIRKFSRDPFQVEDLIRFGTLTPEIADTPVGLRRGSPQHPHHRGHRHRQDHAAQRALLVHPRRPPHHHHRGRRRTAAAPGPRGPPGVPAPQHRGPGGGHHPRPGAQLAAHAARPHHRRRGARRGGPRHAPGDEHRPRGLHVHPPLQLPPGRPQPPGDDGDDGRHRTAGAGHPGVHLLGPEPGGAPGPVQGRVAPDHATSPR